MNSFSSILRSFRPTHQSSRGRKHRRLGMERLERRTLLAADFGLAFGLDSSGAIEIAHDIANDDDGNAYLAGYFNGVLDADPGAGVSNLSSGGGDIGFVAKYGPSGTLVWGQTFGDSGFARATSVSLDPAGNVLVAGSFTGTGDFDPGAGVHNLSSRGSSDGFLLKLDNSGGFVWALNVGGTGVDGVNGLDVDSDANIYAIGNYQSGGSNIDFDPSGSTFAPSINGGGFNDVFVAKYDAAANLSWAKAFGGSGDDHGNDIAVDSAGNAFTTGDFFSGDLDPGPGVFNVTPHGSYDAFVQKLDTNGNFLWGGTVGGPAGANVESGTTVAVDSTGASYFGGIFALTADLDPGPGVANFTATGPLWAGSLLPADGFLIKLDQDGGLVWAQQMGSTGFDVIADLAIDSQDHVLATGHFSGTVDFDPGPGVAHETALGSLGSAGYVWELDPSGTFQSVSRFTGPPQSFSGMTGLSLDSEDSIWTTGLFIDTIDFDPGPATFNLTPVDATDIFVSKLVHNTPPVAVDDSYTVHEDGVLNVNAVDGVLANDSDSDLDPLSVSRVIAGPTSGSLSLNPDGSFTYAPLPDFNGLVSFTYEVSDGNGGLASATVTISVLSTQDQIDNVFSDVEGLVTAGLLNHGQGNSLTSKLGNARKKFDQGKTNAGMNQLEALINQLNAFINAGILDDEDGESLIDQISKAIVSAG